MSEIKAAIDLIDEIDGMPFGQVEKALDRIRELLVKAEAKQSDAAGDFWQPGIGFAASLAKPMVGTP